jgi:hypothetical protein
MKGKRIPDGAPLYSSEPGSYGKDERGEWHAVTPNGHLGALGNHDVVEHDDGTITVSPSIRVSSDSGELWHGWLERGVWREA